MVKFPLDKRIAMIFDFDLTLTEQYMQIPLFETYFDNIKEHHDGRWNYPNGKPIKIDEPGDYFKIVDAWGVPNNGIAYVEQILQDIRDGVFPELTNDDLKEFGSQIKLSPGLPDFFEEMKHKWRGQCDLHFYVVSVGFEAMIRGTAIADVVDKENIFGTQLVSLPHLRDPEANPKEVLSSIRSAVTPFSKSQNILEIAKGGLKNVDRLLPYDEYSFDYRNIETVGDGLSDVSQFALSGKRGAGVFCLYEVGSWKAFNKIRSNPLVWNRVHVVAERNYLVGSGFWNATNRFVSGVLNRTCTMDSVILDMYRKKKVRDLGLVKHVSKHVENCPDCNGGLYKGDFERPSPAYKVKEIWAADAALKVA